MPLKSQGPFFANFTILFLLVPGLQCLSLFRLNLVLSFCANAWHSLSNNANLSQFPGNWNHLTIVYFMHLAVNRKSVPILMNSQEINLIESVKHVSWKLKILMSQHNCHGSLCRAYAVAKWLVHWLVV